MRAKIHKADWFDQNPKEREKFDLAFKQSGLYASSYWIGEEVEIKRIENEVAVTYDNIRLSLEWLTVIG